MSKIYEPAGRAREYSPLALNYFKGCDHGCKYCYVPSMMKRFNKDYDHTDVITKINLKEVEKSAQKMRGINKQILFSFTTDPYTIQNKGETRQILEILNFYKHKVAILSKGGNRILEDIEIFKKYGSRIKIGASFIFDNKTDSLKWEPGATLPDERIEVLKKLSNENIKTWASFEPVIKPDQSLNLLRQVVKFIDHVKIGKINNFQKLDKDIDWGKFIFDCVRILRNAKMNDKFYIKKDLLKFNNGVYLSRNETYEDYLNL